MSALDWALAYASRGWPVFPLAEGSKLPKIPKSAGGRGFHDATCDEEQITSWFTRWPRANVGIRTGRGSGVVVLDVDPRHHGTESLERLEASYGRLPATLLARTPRGGWHYYFSAPEVELRNSASLLDDGLDIRADGGYVASVPSLVSRVGTYDWQDFEAPLAPMPRRLVRRLTKPPPTAPPRAVQLPARIGASLAVKVLAERAQKVATAPQSRRNTTLNAHAFFLGTLVGAGLIDLGRVYAELFAAALAVGLGEREARATIASGLSAGIASPARCAS